MTVAGVILIVVLVLAEAALLTYAGQRAARPEPGPSASSHQASAWALAAASCAAMGIYVPVLWSELGEPEEETLFLGDSQVVLVTIEDGAFVVDCMVREGTQAGWMPFTIHAAPLRGCGRQGILRRLRRWARRAAPVDVSLRRRGKLPIVRLTGRGGPIALGLRSATPIGHDLPSAGC